MDFELEELKLDEELEDIERASIAMRYPFPVVTISTQNIMFNIACNSLLSDVAFIRISTSPNYVVLQPADKASATNFKLGHQNKIYSNRSMALPAALREKKIQRGNYKLYKVNNGWAFKRYEPLKESS